MSINIGGTDVSDITIDGQAVTEVTIDGQVVWTAGPAYLENFEDASMSEYSGATAGASIQSTTVYEGSYALECVPTSNWSSEIFSTTASDKQASAGQTIEFRVYLGSDGATNFLFGVQSAGDVTSMDCYVVYFYTTEFSLARYDNGSWTYLHQSGQFQNLPEGEWLHGVITWGTGGSISVALYNATGTQVGSLSASDSTYTSGGIGFNAYANTVFFDAITAE